MADTKADDADERRDELLKRMLDTPPQPRKPKPPKKGVATTKPSK